MNKTEIKKVNGVPAIVVNGKPLNKFVYRNRLHTEYDYMKQFPRDGHQIMFATLLQDSRESWKDYRKRFEEHHRKIFALGKDFYLFHGYYFNLSEEWVKTNPGNVVFSRGRRPVASPNGKVSKGSDHYFDLGNTKVLHYSLYSEAVREEMRSQALRHLEIIEDSPFRERIIGMFFEGGGAQEWYPYAYDTSTAYYFEDGERAKKSFREYLEKKYGSDAALSRAWGQKGLTFRKVLPASVADYEKNMKGSFLDPENLRRFEDTHDFAATGHRDSVLAGPREIKKIRPELLCGHFNEPIMDNPFFLESWQRVIEDPAVDFVSGPPPYECRCPNDVQPVHSILGSLKLRNKVYFQEEDQRPAKKKGLRGTEEQYSGGVGSEKNFRQVILRQGLQDITCGNYGWWWDFQFQWYRTKGIHETFRQLITIDKWHTEVKGSPAAEIAVIVDEETAKYVRPNGRTAKNLLHRQWIQEMYRIGAPFETYTTEDIGHPDFNIKKYKFYIIPFSLATGNKGRKLLRKLKGGGRTLLFAWGAGYGNPNSKKRYSPDNMKELTGFEFRVHDAKLAPIVIIPDGEHPIQRALGSGYHFGQFFRYLKSNSGSVAKPLFPPISMTSPLFSVSDQKAIVLGYTAFEEKPEIMEHSKGAITDYLYKGVELHPGFAIKDMGSWTSVYAGGMALPGKLLREVARTAGVHIYLEDDDPLYATTKIICMGAGLGGKRSIKLKKNAVVKDMSKLPFRKLGKMKTIDFTAEKFKTYVFGIE